MQPSMLPALVLARTADLQHEAEIARLAGEVKRGQRQGRRGRKQRVRRSQPAYAPERAAPRPV